jgi:hypothetical protein
MSAEHLIGATVGTSRCGGWAAGECFRGGHGQEFNYSFME